MPQLFPPEIIENTVECHHNQTSTKSKINSVEINGMVFTFIKNAYLSIDQLLSL